MILYFIIEDLKILFTEKFSQTRFHNSSIMLSPSVFPPSVFISADELSMFDELFHFYMNSIFKE